MTRKTTKNVVTEAELAGKQVEELARVQTAARSALPRTPLAWLAKHFLVRHRPRDRRDRHREHEQRDELAIHGHGGRASTARCATGRGTPSSSRAGSISRRQQPTAREPGASQAGDDVRTAAHELPRQARPMILDHEDRRPFVQPIVPRRHPAVGPAGRIGTGKPARAMRASETPFPPTFAMVAGPLSRATRCEASGSDATVLVVSRAASQLILLLPISRA